MSERGGTRERCVIPLPAACGPRRVRRGPATWSVQGVLAPRPESNAPASAMTGVVRLVGPARPAHASEAGVRGVRVERSAAWRPGVLIDPPSPDPSRLGDDAAQRLTRPGRGSRTIGEHDELLEDAGGRRGSMPTSWPRLRMSRRRRRRAFGSTGLFRPYGWSPAARRTDRSCRSLRQAGPYSPGPRSRQRIGGGWGSAASSRSRWAISSSGGCGCDWKPSARGADAVAVAGRVVRLISPISAPERADRAVDGRRCSAVCRAVGRPRDPPGDPAFIMSRHHEMPSSHCSWPAGQRGPAGLPRTAPADGVPAHHGISGAAADVRPCAPVTDVVEAQQGASKAGHGRAAPARSWSASVRAYPCGWHHGPSAARPASDAAWSVPRRWRGRWPPASGLADSVVVSR